MSNGKVYLPRFNAEQVEEICLRYQRGETVTELAEVYGRGYDVIRRLVKGKSYQKRPAQPSDCGRCAQADRAADNVIRAREFRGDVKCIGCERLMETSANIVRSRQGRVRCSTCIEERT